MKTKVRRGIVALGVISAMILSLSACAPGVQLKETPEPTETSTLAEVSVALKTATPTREPTETMTPTSESTEIMTPTREPTEAATYASYEETRKQMVKLQMRMRDITDEEVLAAMEKVPRHEFVPEDMVKHAYEDHPLPIGYGQTISQPYIVALMTQLLHLKRDDKVLEIGTGSGYQAAVLAELTDEVYTVEIIKELEEQAEERLQRLGYTDIKVKHDDGYYGWEEYAPYDAIIVTCAPDHVPQPLVKQLRDGGRLVIPVGPPGGYQTLWQIEKRGEQIVSNNITGVLFVPLLGEH